MAYRAARREEELQRGNADCARKSGEAALSRISVQYELSSVIYPELVRQRRYQAAKEEVKRLIAHGDASGWEGHGGGASPVGQAVERAMDEGQARFEG